MSDEGVEPWYVGGGGGGDCDCDAVTVAVPGPLSSPAAPATVGCAAVLLGSAFDFADDALLVFASLWLPVEDKELVLKGAGDRFRLDFSSR